MSTTQTQTRNERVAPNPKDSMKSTWRRLDRTEWTVCYWFNEILGIHPVALDKEVPVHQKAEKVPYLSDWYMYRWVFMHAAVPVLIQHLYVIYTGNNFSAFQAFLFYSAAFNLTAIRELHILRYMGHQTGFLDGDMYERDEVLNVRVAKVVWSLVSTLSFRPIFSVFLSYRISSAGSKTAVILPKVV